MFLNLFDSTLASPLFTFEIVEPTTRCLLCWSSWHQRLISRKTKLHMSILLYESETWLLNKTLAARINGFDHRENQVVPVGHRASLPPGSRMLLKDTSDSLESPLRILGCGRKSDCVGRHWLTWRSQHMELTKKEWIHIQDP